VSAQARSPGDAGLAQGGLGGPEDQLLEAGQEEVFSRAEVESGLIEHSADTQTPPSRKEIKPSSPNADQQGDRHG